METQAMDYAGKIAEWNARPKRGYTYYEMAEVLEIPRATLHRVATGKSKPSRATRRKLAAHGIRENEDARAGAR
jgi:DNA-binding XRE family transcriptional regulator